MRCSIWFFIYDGFMMISAFGFIETAFVLPGRFDGLKIFFCDLFIGRNVESSFDRGKVDFEFFLIKTGHYCEVP